MSPALRMCCSDAVSDRSTISPRNCPIPEVGTITPTFKTFGSRPDTSSATPPNSRARGPTPPGPHAPSNAIPARLLLPAHVRNVRRSTDRAIASSARTRPRRSPCTPRPYDSAIRQTRAQGPWLWPGHVAFRRLSGIRRLAVLEIGDEAGDPPAPGIGPLDRSDAIQDRVAVPAVELSEELGGGGRHIERSFEVGGNLGGGLPAYADCQRPSALAASTEPRLPAGCIFFALVRRRTRCVLIFDHGLRALRGVKRCRKYVSSRLVAPGINPAEAERFVERFGVGDAVTPVPFLAIFIHTPRALSWFASSHFRRHADAVVNARSSSRGVMVPRWPITETVPPAYACSRALLDVRRDRPTRRSVDEIVRTVIGSHGGHLRGSRPPTVLVGSHGKRGLRERRALRARGREEGAVLLAGELGAPATGTAGTA